MTSPRPVGGGPKFRRLNMGQIFIILAIVSAIFTVFVIKGMMSGKVQPKLEAEKTRPLVVASQQLFAGEIIRPESLKVLDWPDKNYPEGYVFDKPEGLIGRAVKNDIFPGQPVYKLALAGEGSQGGMPVVIPPGHRAMTILVTENKGVAGFIKPGDRVDVVGTFEVRFSEASQKKMAEKSELPMSDSLHVTQTVLQDVLVLAIAQEMVEKKGPMEGLKESGSNASAGADSASSGSADAAASSPPPAPSAEADPAKGRIVSSVTVAVTPEQVEKLAFADSRGELRMALRPENEHEQVSLIGALTNDIVPVQNLLRKTFEYSQQAGFDEVPSASDLPPMPPSMPPQMASAPPAPRYTASSAREIQIIEGTSKSSVSF